MRSGSWLDDFVQHTSYGETPPHVMWWCGVSAIAGALRRKVYLDFFNFQWSPNFYILIIGPAGILKKSTSTNLAIRLLRRVDGIDFGPNSITWERMITHMAEAKQEFTIPGKGSFEASCTTIELGEFGTLFDPSNRPLIDALTDLWDAKLGVFAKETKTNGCDIIVNPWLNIIACCTPEWINDNFSNRFIGSGFASRCVYVYCDKPGRQAYPDENMPKGMWERENQLVVRLMEIANLSGEMKLTKEARDWGRKWYDSYRDYLEGCKPSEQGLYSRAQTHLHKLAMVISASKGKFPVIDVTELQEADQRLASLGDSTQQVFGSVGQSSDSKLAQEIVARLKRNGSMGKKELYRKFFFRTEGIASFEEALKSAKASGMIKEGGDMANPFLEVV